MICDECGHDDSEVVFEDRHINFASGISTRFVKMQIRRCRFCLAESHIYPNMAGLPQQFARAILSRPWDTITDEEWNYVTGQLVEERAIRRLDRAEGKPEPPKRGWHVRWFESIGWAVWDDEEDKKEPDY